MEIVLSFLLSEQKRELLESNQGAIFIWEANMFVYTAVFKSLRLHWESTYFFYYVNLEVLGSVQSLGNNKYVFL